MFAANYLDSVIKQFQFNKALADKTFNQLKEENLFWQFNEESNSIAIIVNHLHGNMLSRWTNFLTSDGEKESRDRDLEFEVAISSQKELLEKWEKGWKCLFSAIESLQPEDLERIIYIRNQGHTVTEALNRQLSHYSYHVGQIVFIGKMLANSWSSLSIPRGNSKEYNLDKFSNEKRKEHFTEEFLNEDE